MRTKKKIIAFLSLVIVVMVVAYAAFSANLVISGTANIASEWSVLFTNIEQISKSSGVDVLSEPQAIGTTATFNIGLSSPGDSIEYKITISNEGTLNAIIENIEASETGNEAIIFEIYNIKTGDILNAKKSTTFNIKITYDPNTNSQPSELDNKLTVNVTYAQYLGQNIDSNNPTINGPVLTQLTGNNSITLQNSAGRLLNNYTISGNSIQNGTPTPSAPIEIQSVGVKNDNLYYKSGTITSNLGVTVSYDKETQTYTLNGTTTGVGNIDLSVKMDIPLEVGETFYYTRVIDGGSVEFPSGAYLLYSIFNQENETYIGNRIREDSTTTGNSFIKNQNTLPEKGSSGLYRAYVQCLGVKGIVFNNFKIKLMISKTSPQEYEPYGYKIPVKVSGINLFDYSTLLEQDYIDVIDSNTGEFSFINVSNIPQTNVDAKENTQYNISYEVKLAGQQSVSLAIYYTDGTSSSVSLNDGVVGKYTKVSGVSTANKTIDYIKFGGGGGLQMGTMFKKIQVSEKNSEYEPYIEPTTTNIYLDEPLRCISGNCDYIDFASSTVVRKVRKIVFNGSESWVKFSDKNLYYTLNEELLYGENVYCLSDKYKGQVSSGGGTHSNGDIWLQNVVAYPRIYIYNENYATASDFRSYLSQNNVTGYFPLAIEDLQPINLPLIYIPQGNVEVTVNSNGLTIPIEVSYHKMS